MRAFRHAHIPSGLMTLKKEFRSLRQGNRSVNEYLHKFNQLARYAPGDVAKDEDKQEKFLEGLNDDLFVQLISQDYSDFQLLVNKAIHQEGKHQEMKNRKRRMTAQKFNPRDLPKARGTSSHQVRSQPATSTDTTTINNPDSLESPKTPDDGPPPKDSSYVTGITCFHCHEIGHYANNCPKKQQAANPSNTEVPKVNTMQANRKPQNSGKRHLYNITAQALSDEEQNADEDNST